MVHWQLHIGPNTHCPVCSWCVNVSTPVNIPQRYPHSWVCLMHCTLKVVHITHSALVIFTHSPLYTVENKYGTLYIKQFTIFTIYCTQYSMNCTPHNVQSCLHSLFAQAAKLPYTTICRCRTQSGASSRANILVFTVTQTTYNPVYTHCLLSQPGSRAPQNAGVELSLAQRAWHSVIFKLR